MQASKYFLSQSSFSIRPGNKGLVDNFLTFWYRPYYPVFPQTHTLLYYL